MAASGTYPRWRGSSSRDTPWRRSIPPALSTRAASSLTETRSWQSAPDPPHQMSTGGWYAGSAALGASPLRDWSIPHHHLFQCATRSLTQWDDLFVWLRELYPIWAGIDEEVAAAAAGAGLGWLALSGATTGTDHHYLFPSGGGDLFAATEEAKPPSNSPTSSTHRSAPGGRPGRRRDGAIPVCSSSAVTLAGP